MSEVIGKSCAPGERYQRLYRIWAQGGWGMLITGSQSAYNSFESS